MKQTLLLVATIALLASCNNGGSEETARYKKQVDSLTTLIAATNGSTAKTTEAFATPESGGDTSGDGNVSTYPLGHNAINDQAAMTVTDANTIIQAWHGYVKNHLPAPAMQSLSFTLNADLLKNSVMKETDVTNIVVYIAMKSDSSLTLVLVPAKPDPNNANKLTERPFIFDGSNTQQVFENVQPCPICDKIGVHPGKPTGQ